MVLTDRITVILYFWSFAWILLQC